MSLKRKSSDRFPSSLKPKKQLGQNFLIDQNIARKIIQTCHLQPTDTVLEIGPGRGALTAELLPRVKKVIAIETDRRLIEELRKKFPQDNLELIHADFLKFDVRSLERNCIAISNLPYYICSPIIAKILDYKEFFSSLFVTVQLEFGNRMKAKINTKDYSAFSLFVQYHADCEMLFKIRNTAFRPRPKVQSCFMQLRMRKKPSLAIKNEFLFWRLIRQAFTQRRKTIVNALSSIISKDKSSVLLALIKVNPHSRPENLSLEDFANLANAIE
ncbi:MAG: 16S rRNA (adenine(1518)-N(6)/adenine(1519)-N(6))-dimethyltransferase RsmA [Candidatus Omnitrophota bacterium]